MQSGDSRAILLDLPCLIAGTSELQQPKLIASRERAFDGIASSLPF